MGVLPFPSGAIFGAVELHVLDGIQKVQCHSLALTCGHIWYTDFLSTFCGCRLLIGESDCPLPPSFWMGWQVFIRHKLVFACGCMATLWPHHYSHVFSYFFVVPSVLCRRGPGPSHTKSLKPHTFQVPVFSSPQVWRRLKG